MWEREKELERQKAAPAAPATEAPTAKEPIYLVNIEPVLEENSEEEHHTWKKPTTKVEKSTQTEEPTQVEESVQTEEPIEAPPVPEPKEHHGHHGDHHEDHHENHHEDHHDHHGHHEGHHGGHHGRHHYYSSQSCMHKLHALLLGVLLVIHYYFGRRQSSAINKLLDLTGENKGWWGCC